MPIEHELRALAKTYSEKLSGQIDARRRRGQVAIQELRIKNQEK
ncbi:hypothetical protein SAMN05421881_10869 [Nitrosomonas halophila]|uniref:Uncharacterized protein n=1 Tax=Nitrosomonas halophila TaxID=44576 RepID=A0A1H3P232_9PROT|nr:hypothetical protein SAMN05421881_10869 [Nitrosomonas halophila]